jgi:hypothetical protein
LTAPAALTLEQLAELERLAKAAAAHKVQSLAHGDDYRKLHNALTYDAVLALLAMARAHLEQAEPLERWAVRVLDAWAEKVWNEKGFDRGLPATSPSPELGWAGLPAGTWVIDFSTIAGQKFYQGTTPDLARIAAARALVAESPDLEREPKG